MSWHIGALPASVDIASCWTNGCSRLQSRGIAIQNQGSMVIVSINCNVRLGCNLEDLSMAASNYLLCELAVYATGAGSDERASAAAIAAAAEAAAARGKVWSMLGLMRLHLVMPPGGGQDPARKPALKAAFLSGTARDVFQPELEVRFFAWTSSAHRQTPRLDLWA